MKTGSSNSVIENVRRSLGRVQPSPIPPRPAVLPARVPGSPESEIDLLVQEINKLSGQARQISAGAVAECLAEMVKAEDIHRAAVWNTAWLRQLRLEDVLAACGVEVIPPQAEASLLATCELGITSADFALPETGTLGLLSGADKPRAVSLLPRVHLALVHPSALRPDLHQVFAEASGRAPASAADLASNAPVASPYLVLITGPSRTSDIELTVTLGVHGPRSLYVWILNSGPLPAKN